MQDTFPIQLDRLTANAQARRNSTVLWSWLVFLTGITGLVGLLMARGGANPSSIAWLCYFAGAIAILYRPRLGVYLIIGFALVGDNVLLPWYPFNKNFSSYESILFVSKSLIFSPLETYIVLTYVSWLGRAGMQRKIEWYAGPLFWSMLIFTGFITFGLVYGLSRGGSVNIALWETRSIYYIPAMFVLTTNLVHKRSDVNALLWTIAIALFALSVSGVWFVATELNFNFKLVESIAEHGFSIRANTFFILLIAAWLFRDTSVKRIVLPLMSPLVLISYFANQRRAGYITIAIALLIVAIVLYRENRRAFWLIVPIVCVCAVVYLAAFWNASGGLGAPARAIKSVIVKDAGNARDNASNVYRVIEDANIMFTIKTAPLTGIGFGKPFYIVYPMPDISFFIWWQYITHNSIMWMWMQAGVGGFISMLFLIGSTIINGLRVLWRMPSDNMSVAALTAVLYVVMHFIYAYVDMSWDIQSMAYIGVMIGLINCLEHLVSRQEPQPTKRWPWQSDPVVAPGPGTRDQGTRDQGSGRATDPGTLAP